MKLLSSVRIQKKRKEKGAEYESNELDQFNSFKAYCKKFYIRFKHWSRKICLLASKAKKLPHFDYAKQSN